MYCIILSDSFCLARKICSQDPQVCFGQISDTYIEQDRNLKSLIDTYTGSSKVHSESNDLLNGMKRYLRIEHQDDDKKLLEYLRKQQVYIENSIQIWSDDQCAYYKDR
jgi:hypothetical protein